MKISTKDIFEKHREFVKLWDFFNSTGDQFFNAEIMRSICCAPNGTKIIDTFDLTNEDYKEFEFKFIVNGIEVEPYLLKWIFTNIMDIIKEKVNQEVKEVLEDKLHIITKKIVKLVDEEFPTEEKEDEW